MPSQKSSETSWFWTKDVRFMRNTRHCPVKDMIHAISCLGLARTAYSYTAYIKEDYIVYASGKWSTWFWLRRNISLMNEDGGKQKRKLATTYSSVLMTLRTDRCPVAYTERSIRIDNLIYENVLYLSKFTMIIWIRPRPNNERYRQQLMEVFANN